MNGANVDHGNLEGQTPLFLSASRGWVDQVSLLLASHANPSLKDVRGISPLMIAVQKGHDKVVDMLRRYYLHKFLPALPNVATLRFSGSATTPVTDVRETLSSSSKIIYEINPLLQSAAIGDLSKVSRLIRDGVDLETSDQLGYTALALAAEKGYYDIVRILIMNGANVDHGNLEGQTPLFLSASRGWVD